MVELAGGVDVLGRAAVKSRVVEWDEIEAAAAPTSSSRCRAGSTPPRPRRRPATTATGCGRSAAGEVYAVDAASSFSRPGPRLVDGVELLAHLLHPELVEAPAGIAFERPLDPATPVRSRPPQ